MRTFIAIKINPERKLFDIFSTLKKSLEGEAINWVDINNLHLTLRFLGETTHEQIPEIVKSLKNISLNFQPFQFSLKGAGFFKSKNQPRVLFLSVENDGVLKQLAAEIEDGIESLGFDKEEREFNPHLTVGRIKFNRNKNAFYSLIEEFRSTEIQQITVSELIFYQSILTSAGAVYKPLHVTQLKK